MKENFQHVLDKIKEVYARLELRQRLMIAILLAVTFGIIIWMISWSTGTEYGLLFSRLTAEDAQRTINRLNELQIPYRLRDEGTSIFIPQDRVYEIRIALASDNIGMRNHGVGFEIFDRTTLGTTEFVQRNVNWRRAMEGELQRTIASINGVEDVRIHLVFPEERIFREDQREPSAGVSLRLSRRLNENQIQGITNLIASSVEGLDPSRITIIDQDGRTLTENFDDNLAGLSNQQLRIQNQVENQYQTRVQSMLDEMLGFGNSVVRVNAVVNFDQVETTMEIFDPDGQVVRSEEISLNNITNLRDSVATVNEHQITNFEISSTVSTRRNQVGDIKRLTVSVNVNHRTNRTLENGRETIEYIERSEAELNQIDALVRGSIGFDQARGDLIVVSNMLFDRADSEFARAERERQEMIRQYIALAERGAVIVVLIVLVLVLISQFKKIFAKPEEEEEVIEEEVVEEELLEPDLRPAFVEGVGPEGFYPEGDEGMPMGDSKIQMTFKPMRDITIEQTEAMLLQEAVQKFVIENPEVAVRLIKSWLLDKQYGQIG
ncbi:MAG: flagellar M-ring protein FliF [Candidatus Cloacimonetes bacterium]|nr:flagellar M-ring protein FliF [Candidatus Cloacimonadota bacterium]